jgi:outer membrane protein TolC
MILTKAVLNIRYFLFYFIFTCLVTAIPVFSEEVPVKASLELDTLIKEVIERNPNLQAVRERINAAQIASSRARVLEDPRLDIMTENTPFKKESELNKMISYQVTQEFPFPGKRALRKKIADQSIELVRAEELTTVLDLVFQTKKIYYELYFNQAERRINEKNRDVIRRFVDGATFRYKTGIGEYHEVLKAQVEFEMLQSEYLSLEMERKSMMAMLNAVLDLPPMTETGEPVEAFTQARNFKYEELEKIAMQNRPELSGMQAMIIEQRTMADMARREYYPDFMLSALYQQNTGGMENAWGVGVGISLPIWIEKKQKSELREAESKASAFESSLRGMRAMIRSEIQDALIKVQNAEQRISLYKESIIPSTLQTLESIESKYRAGKENFIMLLDTRRQLQEIELSYERARVEREEFIAGLERAVGTKLK